MALSYVIIVWEKQKDGGTNVTAEEERYANLLIQRFIDPDVDMDLTRGTFGILLQEEFYEHGIVDLNSLVEARETYSRLKLYCQVRTLSSREVESLHWVLFRIVHRFSHWILGQVMW